MFGKRKFPRLRQDYRITYRIVEQEEIANDPISSLAINISGGGLCFEADGPIKKGVLVALDIRSDDFGAPILALAKVVWCKSQRSPYQIGVEFWWVGWRDTKAQATIANYVASQTVLASTPVYG